MSPQEEKIRERLSSILVDTHFRPIEKRIMLLLADGEPHYNYDLVPLLEDDQAQLGNVHDHICNIRKKITHLGHAILCEYINRRRYYRYVILLSSLVRK